MAELGDNNPDQVRRQMANKVASIAAAGLRTFACWH
jgi:hypothetical protein